MALRVSRNVWIGGGVVVAAGLAVGVGWLLAGPSGGEEADPTPRMTVTADAEDPTPEPSDVDPYEGDLDGILADEYPEAAPTRTDPNPAHGDGTYNIDYPTALVLEDWVWDRVGPGWSVEVVSSAFNYAGDDWVQPPAVLYLVSSEDVYFEIAELPERMWDDARVVSWLEDEEVARVTWAGGWASALYELRSGESEDIVFSSYGANAGRNSFVSADAEGNELWSATSSNGTKLYRWDAAAHEWAAASAVDDFPDALAWWEGVYSTTVTSEDGDSVVLLEYDGGDVSGDFVLYNLASDTSTPFEVPQAAGLPMENVGTRIVDGVVVMEIWTGSQTPTVVGYDIASGTISQMDEAPQAGGGAAYSGGVAYGEATSRGATHYDCGC